MVELVAIMVILGILAVVALPRLNDMNALRAVGFHDEIVAALRYAQKTAVSHRRLVCATVTSSTVTLTIANSNPANACGNPLNGPDGNAAFARSQDTVVATVTSPPNGTLFFQPTGRITSDAAGNAPTDYTITVMGMAPITVVGTTGYVR